MIDNLPEDVITLILNNLEEKNKLTKNTPYLRMDINYILSLRNINKFFKGYIEKQNKLWYVVTDGKIIDKRSTEIDTLCLKNTPVSIFIWLFENNINLSIKNIQNLIIKNRVDVVRQGLHNRDFLKTLFNRFHLCSNNDILSLSNNINPMSAAVRHDRVEIVRILLESGNHGNPYLNQINSVFEESIKYVKTGTLNYLLVNYYDKLKETVNRKFNTIILRFSNIEDILFYITINQKAQITRENMKSLISKNYIDLFKYCYEKHIHGKNNSDLLLKCVESNSFVIFDYLMVNGSYINPIEFSTVFLSKKKHHIIFLNMILDNYSYLLPVNTNIISVSIKNKVDFGRIEKLINNNYHYDEKDIINVLEQKDIKLAKLMINAYDN